MNDALEILVNYIQPLGIQCFCESLQKAAKEVERFCRTVQNDSLSSFVKKSLESNPDSLNGWILPDALWLSICHDAPDLNLYPLGEIAERTFKKVIITLSFFGNGREKTNPNVGLNTLQKNLRNSIEEKEVGGVLGLFLKYYLFEICMDYLRRSRSGAEDDFSYLYHFPEEGHSLSLSDEKGFREQILSQSKKASDQLLPPLLESIHEINSELPGKKLLDHYCRIIDLPEPDQTIPSQKPSLNVIVSRKSKANLRQHFRLDPNTVRLLINPAEGSNVTIQYQRIENALAQNHRSLGGSDASQVARAENKTSNALHSLCKDLLEIGTIVYMADQMVKRAGHLGRHLDIWMPVRHVEIWKKNHDKLAQAVSFLGRDRVNFYFIKHTEDTQPLKFTKPDGDENRCVCLLSGGLDSTAGAVWATKNGEKPIFVSHSANSYLTYLQKELVEKLKPTQNNPLTHFSIFIGKSRAKKVPYRLPTAPASPMKQFLRSFLYLSTASVVALESGCRKIYVFENGPIALNPMFSEARVNTRTAHPRFLELFQELVNSVSKTEIYFVNPFLYKTKGEVVAHLSPPESADLVRKTTSCWNWFNVPLRARSMGKSKFPGRHDGDCLPCVIRRAATEHANLEDVKYLIDVFTEFPELKVDKKILIADYMRFCVNIKTMSDAELLLACPDFSVGTKGIEPEELAAMYRKHTNEMIKAFCTRSPGDIVQLVIPT